MIFFADVETTGVRVTDRVVEVAWLLTDYDFHVKDRGHSLINPGMPIPAAASAVHGIIDRDVLDAPTLDQYFYDVLGNKLSGLDAVFCAHSAAFDWRFIGGYLPESTPHLCTLKLARRLWPDAENHKLATLVYALELDVAKDRFHSADGDMAALMALLQRAVEGSGLSVAELIDLAHAPDPNQKMPFGKHRGAFLKELPPNYVWWLLNKADNLDADLRAALQAL